MPTDEEMDHQPTQECPGIAPEAKRVRSKMLPRVMTADRLSETLLSGLAVRAVPSEFPNEGHTIRVLEVFDKVVAAGDESSFDRFLIAERVSRTGFRICYEVFRANIFFHENGEIFAKMPTAKSWGRDGLSVMTYETAKTVFRRAIDGESFNAISISLTRPSYKPRTKPTVRSPKRNRRSEPDSN